MEIGGEIFKTLPSGPLTIGSQRVVVLVNAAKIESC